MYREAQLICVACRGKLAAEPEHPQYQSCAGCGSAFVTRDVFAKLAKKQVGRALPDILVHEYGDPPRVCPVCAEQMRRVWIDALPLEECADHGIWFNRGELDLAMKLLKKSVLPAKPMKPIRKRWGR